MVLQAPTNKIHNFISLLALLSRCYDYGSVWIELILLKLKTYCWNHCSKMIFKYVNSTVGPIFNEKIDKKWNLWVHEQCINALFIEKSQHLRLLVMHCSLNSSAFLQKRVKKKKKRKKERKKEEWKERKRRRSLIAIQTSTIFFHLTFLQGLLNSSLPFFFFLFFFERMFP